MSKNNKLWNLSKVYWQLLLAFGLALSLGTVTQAESLEEA